MNFIQQLAFILLVSAPLSSFAQTTTDEQKDVNVIRHLSIEANGFGGTIVIDVVDENNNPVYNYQAILVRKDEVIFDVPQEGPRSTFFENGKKITFEIRKEGYQSFLSTPFKTDPKMEMACYIKVTLKKEQ